MILYIYIYPPIAVASILPQCETPERAARTRGESTQMVSPWCPVPTGCWDDLHMEKKALNLWLCQNSYWKWPFIVDFPIENGDFP